MFRETVAPVPQFGKCACIWLLGYVNRGHPKLEQLILQINFSTIS